MASGRWEGRGGEARGHPRDRQEQRQRGMRRGSGNDKPSGLFRIQVPRGGGVRGVGGETRGQRGSLELTGL